MMGIEMSLGSFSVFNTSDDLIFFLGSFTYAVQTAYYLRDHTGNSPYLLGRISRTRLGGSDFLFMMTILTSLVLEQGSGINII